SYRCYIILRLMMAPLIKNRIYIQDIDRIVAFYYRYIADVENLSSSIKIKDPLHRLFENVNRFHENNRYMLEIGHQYVKLSDVKQCALPIFNSSTIHNLIRECRIYDKIRSKLLDSKYLQHLQHLQHIQHL